MILDFQDAETKTLFETGRTRKFQTVKDVAQRKLNAVNQAGKLSDLRVPPGNRLEPLHGDRAGQYSIRINNQYRVCFVWNDETGNASQVEVTDYH